MTTNRRTKTRTAVRLDRLVLEEGGMMALPGTAQLSVRAHIFFPVEAVLTPGTIRLD
jgi:hypothetical protein